MATQNRKKYLEGYDNISWSNTPRPKYQGSQRTLQTTPYGVVIDVSPTHEASKHHGVNGEDLIVVTPKFVPQNVVF